MRRRSNCTQQCTPAVFHYRLLLSQSLHPVLVYAPTAILSAIFCLGEHSGGDLAVYSPSTKAWSSLHARGQWRTWDGKMPHFTRAFRGERFSIVFYTHRQCFRLSAEGRRALAALGFRYPSQEASGGGSRGGSGGPFAGDTTARAQALMAEALAALRVRGVGGEWTKSGASEAGAEAEASGVAFPGTTTGAGRGIGDPTVRPHGRTESSLSTSPPHPVSQRHLQRMASVARR